ncbi:pepsin/retropepsin-like aspartic protease family protein [Sphingobacterium faecale]|uniref:Aspartyl protease family protein n=1 Tax=Sphingobacterium faecale TaxID=2803775 RepID=A0ABS1R5F8_9SPHI|nr:pepsin/retropepsin-like aspartic protease family protein [Sphingobacterium faecale]MBL1409932.1 aspartyl protease family protein [Sphingobacterium faecale]
MKTISLNLKSVNCILITLLLFCQHTLGQSKTPVFNNIYMLIEQKNFFSARDLYKSQQSTLTEPNQKIIEAILDNAFNNLSESNIKIDKLNDQYRNLPDSIQLKLDRVQTDNYIKLFQYKNAENAFSKILNKHAKLLSGEELDDVKNSHSIWTTLANENPQRVFISETNILKLFKDKVGLNNLRISTANNAFDFVFDTGANLSTISKSIADSLGVKLFPSFISVKAITGHEVQAQLGICPEVSLGTIKIENIIFLVMDDEALSFPTINYHIKGILGFPVITALREIKITNDDFLIVPKTADDRNVVSNMAFDELTPLIFIDGMHFSFDTGASGSILYSNFFRKFQKEIDMKYTSGKINLGGAGGTREFEGYMVSLDSLYDNGVLFLNNVPVLKEKIIDRETVYGNIGQDFIKNFSAITINFQNMNIEFN